MNYSLAFVNRDVVVYVAPQQNALQASQIKDLLSYLEQFCRYTLVNDINSVRTFNRQNAIMIFLISSLADFKRLQELRCLDASVNIVGYFLYTEDFQQVNNKSFRAPIKAQFFNLIYPNENKQGLFYPSKKKVLDRIYEKTVRTKYASIQIGDDISHFTRLDMKEKFSGIREISLYFKDMGLNSDDNMAGAIAIRFGDGMLTNASKTDKCNITEDRICYLKDYNSKGNQVYWAGSKLPSSESPISFLAFQEFPDANILLHFHYKPITYSSKLAMYRTKKYVEYGTYNEAKTLVNKLKETGGFAIAQGHGEFIVASDLAEVKAKISEIIAMIS